MRRKEEEEREAARIKDEAKAAQLRREAAERFARSEAEKKTAAKYIITPDVSEVTLRETEAVNSELVTTLTPGTEVLVAEIKGNRARLVSPADGWISLQTNSGVVAARKVEPLVSERYRVVGEVGASLRKTPALDSELLTTIPVGTFVDIDKIEGRRAHVIRPQEGWVSLYSAEGYVITEKAANLNRRMTVVGEAGATLRATIELDSELYTTLQPQTTVLAVEFNGRRVRVIEPRPGWCSQYSADGYVILR